jgi:hypothetical protein
VRGLLESLGEVQQQRLQQLGAVERAVVLEAHPDDLEPEAVVAAVVLLGKARAA